MNFLSQKLHWTSIPCKGILGLKRWKHFLNIFQGYKCVPGGLLEQCNLPRTGWKTSPKQNWIFSRQRSRILLQTKTLIKTLSFFSSRPLSIYILNNDHIIFQVIFRNNISTTEYCQWHSKMLPNYCSCQNVTKLTINCQLTLNCTLSIKVTTHLQ